MISSRTFASVLVLSVATVTAITATGASAFDRFGPWPDTRSKGQVERFARLDSTALDSFIVYAMNQYNVPGVAACVTKDADLVWARAYGWGNIEHSIAVTDTTMFVLASVSKLMTATAVMQLWEDSRFTLDDPINEYLDSLQVAHPLYPNIPITFRMLLTHTSGIDDNWSFLDTLYTYGADSPIPLGEFLEGYLLPGGQYYHSLNWTSDPPGEYEYSGVGFALLGYLVEEISGVPFDQYCDASIFGPLGMSRTSWRLAGLDQTTVAMPYEWQGTQHDSVGHYGYPFYPCGLLRSSSLDVSRFLRAFLYGGEFEGSRILESSTVDTMTTHQLPDLLFTSHWFYIGLAWQHFQLGSLIDENIWCWGHPGGDFGINTFASYCPAHGESWSVTVLMNLKSTPALASITYEVAQFAHDTFGDTSVVLSGTLVADQLALSWPPIPAAEGYWVYGAGNQAHFLPGFAPFYVHRLVVLPPWSTTWSSGNGVGDPSSNWSYLVIAVDAAEQELWRSNRVGEFDLSTTTEP